MFTTLFQIAKNTFRESLREPIYLLILLSALVLILIYPVFTLFVFFGQEKLVIDSSMATMMVFGWGLAIMISSYAISREIDNGTAPHYYDKLRGGNFLNLPPCAVTAKYDTIYIHSTTLKSKQQQ